MAGGIFGVGYDTTGGIPPPLTAVVTDATLTGDGTLANPLSVVQDYWRLDGNTTANPANLLGTLSNTNVRTITNSAVIATWFSTGQIGVGLVDADTPLGRFHIRGTGATSATTEFFTENSTAARSFSIDDASQLKRTAILWSIHPNDTDKNEGVGLHTLAALTSGTQNTAIGNNAGLVINSGSDNTLLGYNAGKALTTQGQNAIFGTNAGAVFADSNGVFFGYEAGKAITTGQGNVFVGYRAGLVATNTTRNTFVGESTGLAHTTGGSNTLVGYHAGLSVTSGTNNVFVGDDAGRLATGSNNIYIGGSGGYAMTSGNHNIFLGYSIDGITATLSNLFVVGSTYAPILNAYIGSGLIEATAPAGTVASITLNATGGSGTNINAANFNLAAGKGTGLGTPGVINLQTPTVLGTGTTLQSLTTRATFGQTNVSLFPHGTSAGNTYELRFLELVAGGTNYTGFKSPGAITASLIYELPTAPPTVNQILETVAIAGGVATLNWITAPVANNSYGSAGFVQYSDGAGAFLSNGDGDFAWDNSTLAFKLGTITGPAKMGINVVPAASPLAVAGLVNYATNAAAITGGLAVGDFYRTAGVVSVVI